MNALLEYKVKFLCACVEDLKSEEVGSVYERAVLFYNYLIQKSALRG